MEVTYYLPIKSENLGIYFSRALIAPAKYIKNRNSDIQDYFSNALLISSKHKIGNSDCALELVFTDEEFQLLKSKQVSNECWLFDKPLPITRVKKILFEEENIAKSCITSIELNTAFVPKELLQIITFEEADIPKNEISGTDNKDWFIHIQQFNQLLGGLALMRLVTVDDMNFSENYFSKLSDYNEFIYQELQKAKRTIKSDLYREGGYYSLINKHYISKKIDESILTEVAKIENQKIIWDKSRRIITKNLEKATYILAILREYKANDNDDGRINIDSLILNRFSTIKEDKAEEVAFYYGFNRGYSAFTKTYKNIEYKYRLDSKLDYYTVESIYQKQINGVSKSVNFPYLTTWCPNKEDEIKNKSFSVYGHKYIILDTIVIGKKREAVGSDEYINELHFWGINTFESIFSQELRGIPFPSLLRYLLSEIIRKISKDKDWEFEEKLNELSKQNENLQQEIERLKKESNTSTKAFNATTGKSKKTYSKKADTQLTIVEDNPNNTKKRK